ncbi:MAG: AcrR family transcriptional regulator [Planctomycetota bacterium]|jgi:AcrR family transcriptional regulator
MVARDESKEERLPLTRERVLRAAIELADSGGIDALSMRKLAHGLGVEAMSLYNHVKNKDDVLDGMTDIVVAKIELPGTEDDWMDAMRVRARSAHRVLLEHTWVSHLIVSRVNIGPGMLRYVDATIGCLREAGFSYQQADRAWNAIDSHIYGFTMLELNFPIEASEYADVAQAYLPMLDGEIYPYLRALTQQVADGEHYGLQDFEFGLELILGGLEYIRALP